MKEDNSPDEICTRSDLVGERGKVNSNKKRAKEPQLCCAMLYEMRSGNIALFANMQVRGE